MKRHWGNVLVLPVALAILALGAMAALAAPFVVGNTSCGDLKKVRTETGQVIWKLTGCAPMEDLVQAGLCGNGVVDQGEICDTALAGSCGGETCVDCVECTSVPPTPTPYPTATPTPVPTGGSADCPEGEVPPLGRIEAPDWLGVEMVPLSPREVHTYCLTIGKDTDYLQINVADRSGQCLWNRLTVYPPAGTRLSPQENESRDTSVGYSYSNLSGCALSGTCKYIPRGTYIVKIEALMTCEARYNLWIDPSRY